MTDVSVVVGNYQGAAVLPDCLASLATQTQPAAELIVVDAGSADDSPALATAAGARVLDAPNLGLGYLYNRGTEASASPYVLLLNNDVALEPRCLEMLATALDADARRFSADPKQLGWDGETLVHSRTTLRRGPLLHALLPGFVLDMRAPASDVVPTVCTNAGAMIVRRELLLELGGFDETFFLDFEDLDLGWRAWTRGWSSVYVPDAVVRHRVGATSGSVARRRLVGSHHNLVRFAVKCLPPTDAARILLAEILRIPVHPTLIPPALVQVARELPAIRAARRELGASARFRDWALAGMPGEAP